jgi:hypothetical protein
MFYQDGEMSDLSSIWDRVNKKLTIDNTKNSVTIHLASMCELLELKVMIEEIIDLERDNE